MRLIEILVGVNALCGIAAFLIARGAIRRGQRKGKELLGLEEGRDDQGQ